MNALKGCYMSWKDVGVTGGATSGPVAPPSKRVDPPEQPVWRLSSVVFHFFSGVLIVLVFGFNK